MYFRYQSSKFKQTLTNKVVSFERLGPDVCDALTFVDVAVKEIVQN